MKPKVLCSHCNALLQWEQVSCPSCGAAIDWPAGPAPARTERTERRTSSSPQYLWPAVAVAVVAVGVFAYAVLTENRPSPVPAAQTPVTAPPLNQPMAAPNMNAMAQVQALEERVKAAPNDLQTRLEYANILHDNAFYDKAIDAYRTYLAKRPNDPNARVDLGICLQSVGRNDEAIAEMRRALKDDPKHLQAHINIGVVLLKEEKLAEATEWFRKTVALSPNSEVGQRAQQMLSQHNPQQFNQSQ